jgi:hypothetical protein
MKGNCLILISLVEKDLNSDKIIIRFLPNKMLWNKKKMK